MAKNPSRANRSVTSRICAFTPNASCITRSPRVAAAPAGRATYSRIEVPSLTFVVTNSPLISIMLLPRESQNYRFSDVNLQLDPWLEAEEYTPLRCIVQISREIRRITLYEGALAAHW